MAAAPGRKPLPTHLKVLKGTAQPCRTQKNEPTPKADKVKMPFGLSGDAKKHWRVVSKQLIDAGVLTNLDVFALQMYCEAFARWAHANAQIQKYGPVVKTPNGFPAQSPYLQIANKAFDQMKGMLTEFGMTPSSRTRINAEPQQESDPLDDYLKRKR